jgi:hypothetical protein
MDKLERIADALDCRVWDIMEPNIKVSNQALITLMGRNISTGIGSEARKKRMLMMLEMLEADFKAEDEERRRDPEA